MTDSGGSDDRRKRNIYAWRLTLFFGIAYLAVMYIPFGYDLLNVQIFHDAEGAGQLVIQEYAGINERVVGSRCELNANCNNQSLFIELENRRLIALDYVFQMRRASTLSPVDFVTRSGFFLLPTLLLLYSFARSFEGQRRGVILVATFVISLALFPLISGLPHSNGKFYYIFGTTFSVLIAIADGLNGVLEPTFESDAAQELRNDALSILHQKWTRILILSISIMIVFIGTSAITLWDYMNRVFGSSFSFYPFVGVLIATAFAGVFFYVGIFRGIVRIQRGIEGAMGLDKPADAD
jgi:hypothetical protein